MAATKDKDKSPAQLFARSIFDQVKGGEIARNINESASAAALALIHKVDKNIVMITDGSLQYFIDKTKPEMIDEVRRILNYKQRIATEEWKNAEAAINQLNELKP